MMIEGKEIVVQCGLARIARLRAEYYERINEPERFIEQIRRAKMADLASFVQSVNDREPKHQYPMEWDNVSVVAVSTYEHWWKKQINDKTRNMVRKAQKNGIEIRTVPFDDAMVQAIMGIYNESPIRQGKKFLHYGKDLETTRRAHASFLERSDFIGAFLGAEMIGFIKLVHSPGASNIMQIICKLAHLSKAPTNALIAKAVELCAQKQVPYLHYGIWSRRGLGEFKQRHAFERLQVPRYYVPISVRGRLALKCGAHRGLKAYIPEKWIDPLANLRSKWYGFRFKQSIVG